MGGNDERIFMVKVETADGDGYIFITEDAQRAIEQFEESIAKFSADRVQGYEGFERLALPLMSVGDSPAQPNCPTVRFTDLAQFRLGSTDRRNTSFLEEKECGDEAASADLLFGCTAIRDLGPVAARGVDEFDRAAV